MSCELPTAPAATFPRVTESLEDGPADNRKAKSAVARGNGMQATFPAPAAMRQRLEEEGVRFSPGSSRPALIAIKKQVGAVSYLPDQLVELMRKTANSTSTANRAAIQLDTCIVRVSKNWFVVVGTCQK